MPEHRRQAFARIKRGAHIVSTLGGMARRGRDGGVISSSAEIRGNRRHENVKPNLVGRCAHTPPSATSYRKTSPHQSLRDSFSSRRSRLAAHRLHFREVARRSRDGGVKFGGMRAYRPTLNVCTKTYFTLCSKIFCQASGTVSPRRYAQALSCHCRQGRLSFLKRAEFYHMLLRKARAC